LTRYIHLTPRFTKRLQALFRADKKAVLAAEKAKKIVTELKTKGKVSLRNKERQTKHKELRIRNCIKYNLGKGYRMISVKEDNRMFFLFIGTHDECDLWLENNKDLPKDLTEFRNETFIVQNNLSKNNTAKQISPVENEDEEDPLLKNIDDNILRQIFCGLAGEQP
jgi:mRNA-degrading endonuclease RelE of RelBE toxin-antitoxin system